MQTGDQPDPELRGPKDIVVKVHAVALNPIDYKRRQGVLKMLLKEKWPHIIGYDFSGMVTNCGDSVDKFAVGDEVFGMLPHDSNGALAEYSAAVPFELAPCFVVVEAEYISKKPSNLTHVEAAALPLVTQTALQCFRLGQLAENKKVLITGGAGGAGSMAIQIAKTVFKAKTVATTASTKKLERMRLLGADEAVDYGHERFERELAEYDFAMDCTGEAKQCFECITRGGAVVSIAETPTWKSLSTGDLQGLTVSYFLGFILDCLSSSVTRRARLAQITYEYMFVVADGAVMGEIRQLAEQRSITPVIDKVFPLEKADMAMEYLEAGHAMGKVIVQLVDTTKAS
ncbi:Quinone oxidoreductase protein [Phytophthora nicotianae]|uniref:Quinone oxidoreductase protein n=1 Tax=Phytophthora nicotianae TaxID=4792 RepID=A0A0W8CBD0_PHYNI|nr:Quinone oxidoreductase protein [Phytophthora nicotianae]